MRNKILVFKKRNYQELTLLIAVATLLFISSCTNREEFGPGCLKLKQARIERNWVPGFTKPGNNKIIWVKFMTTYDKRNDKFKVDIIGVDKDSADIQGSEINDIYKPSKCPIILPPIAIGDNYVKLAELDIINADGTIKKFKHLLLTPMESTANPTYMNFKWEVIDESIKVLAKGYTNPCPPCPYCVPKCVDAIEQ